MFWSLWRKQLASEQHRVLQEAQTQAEAIVREAGAQAERIIRETHFFTRQVRTDLQKSLLAQAEATATETQEELSVILQSYQTSLQELLNRLERAGQEQIAMLGRTAMDHLQTVEKGLTEYAQGQEKAIDTFVKQEKEERLQRWQVAAQEKLPKILEELVGKSLQIEDHQTIVKEKLEELKRLRA